MNNTLHKHYDALEPEERFRLLLRAAGRGDDLERERLLRAGERLTFSVADVATFARAFEEVSTTLFTEVLADAGSLFEALRYCDDPCDEGDGDLDDESEDADDEEDESDIWERDEWRGVSFAMARGFLLKTRVRGWELFCKRMGVPPFLDWTPRPGYDLLQRALMVAERVAFSPNGMVNFFRSLQTEGEEPFDPANLMTAESLAKEAEQFYLARADFWAS
jgi:hypothetical protein